MDSMETRMDSAEEKVLLMGARLENVELVAQQAKKECRDVKEDAAKIVFEELGKREDRRLNIVMHSIGECEEGLENEIRK